MSQTEEAFKLEQFKQCLWASCLNGPEPVKFPVNFAKPEGAFEFRKLVQADDFITDTFEVKMTVPGPYYTRVEVEIRRWQVE
jgi:hypothetical protein